MNVIETPLPGVVVLEPRIFRDTRGLFLETWNQARFAQAGLPERFVQDNVSVSHKGVVRGLHYQYPTGQGKLVMVLHGAIYDVAVDIRVGSPTYGQWFGCHLTSEDFRQLYIPEGFAHGFVVTGETAVVAYKCTAPYVPAEEGGVRWDDPEIGIDWPVDQPILSPKDAAAPMLKDIAPERRPKYEG